MDRFRHGSREFKQVEKMNTCEICEKRFHGKQAWATICPKCAKEIADYRAGLWKEKKVITEAVQPLSGFDKHILQLGRC